MKPSPSSDSFLMVWSRCIVGFCNLWVLLSHKCLEIYCTIRQKGMALDHIRVSFGPMYLLSVSCFSLKTKTIKQTEPSLSFWKILSDF